MRQTARRFALAALIPLVAGCETVRGLNPFADPAAAPAGGAPPDGGLAYDAKIIGADEAPALRADLEALSRLVGLKDRLPPSEAALRRRADDDVERLRQAAQAEGYWAAETTLVYESTARPSAVIEVKLGPRYRLETVRFRTVDGAPPALLEKYHPLAFGLALGQPARSAPIVAAEGRVRDVYARIGHPFAAVPDRRVVVDHATRTMDVTYTVDPGPAARFGEARLAGLSALDAAYVRNRIAWAPGEIWNQRKLDETRQLLSEAGLFNAVRLTRGADAPDAAGLVPVTVELGERAPRSVGGGLRYDTSEGIGARAFWEHRNLFGEAERLRVSADLAQNRLGLLANLRKPDLFNDPLQTFVAQADLAQEQPDAYESTRAAVSAGIERRLGPRWTTGVSLRGEQARITDVNGTQNYTLIGLPTFLRRDSTDDLLNPTQGSRQLVAATPWSVVAGDSPNFLQTRVQTSGYAEITTGGRVILAGYGAVGTIFGGGRDAIPADKRLYAGGGGSVRGYAYQFAGPLGSDGNPIGGKSSLEAGAEVRILVTDAIGIVPFFEGGNVYESTVPGGKLLYGAGIGLRYLTPVGPLRFDIGVPLNKRAEDDPFQLYISLGQAF